MMVEFYIIRGVVNRLSAVETQQDIDAIVKEVVTVVRPNNETLAVVKACVLSRRQQIQDALNLVADIKSGRKELVSSESVTDEELVAMNQRADEHEEIP